MIGTNDTHFELGRDSKEGAAKVAFFFFDISGEMRIYALTPPKRECGARYGIESLTGGPIPTKTPEHVAIAWLV